MNSVLRQNLLNQRGPLDQAYAFSIKTVLISDLIHFFYITDPVHIKMVKRKSAFFILLDNGKGRAVDRLRNAKTAGKALGKYGFSHSQISIQAIYFSRLCF